MYQINLKSRCVVENCVPVIVYSRTVHANKPRPLKAFIDDIFL